MTRGLLFVQPAPPLSQYHNHLLRRRWQDGSCKSSAVKRKLRKWRSFIYAALQIHYPLVRGFLLRIWKASAGTKLFKNGWSQQKVMDRWEEGVQQRGSLMLTALTQMYSTFLLTWEISPHFKVLMNLRAVSWKQPAFLLLFCQSANFSDCGNENITVLDCFFTHAKMWQPSC